MSTFTLDYEVDTSQLQSLVKALQNVKTEAGQAATALTGVGGAGSTAAPGIKRAGDELHGLSLNSAGARRELIVLGHEMVQGNWSRFGGSLMVMAERMDAMKLLLSPVGIGVAAVAAAVGLVGYEMVKGAQEVRNFNNALQLTGNYAGQTFDSFNRLAHAVGTDTVTSFSKAKEATMLLAQSGKFTGEELQKAATVMVDESKLTGASLKDLAKDYEKMPEGIVKWALSHNQQMHFMDEALFEHIRTLEQTGKKHEAMNVLLDALKDHVQPANVQLGYLGTSWKFVGDMIDKAKSSLMSWGRDKSLEEQMTRSAAIIGDIQRRIATLSGPAGANGISVTNQQQIDNLQKQLAAEQKKLQDYAYNAGAVNQLADQKSAKSQRDTEAVDTANSIAELLKRAKAQDAYTEAVKRTREEFAKTRANNPNSELGSAANEKAVMDYLARLYRPKTDPATKQEYEKRIADLRGDMANEKTMIDTQITELETSYIKGEINEQQFEDKKAEIRKKGIQFDVDAYAQMLSLANKYGAAKSHDQATFFADEKNAQSKLRQVDAEAQKAKEEHFKRMKAIQDSALLEAQKFNLSLQLSNDKANRQLFMTSGEREKADKIDSINNKYKEMADAQREKMKGASDSELQQALSSLEAEHTKALQIEEDSMQRRIQLQSDWQNGASLAFKQYLEDAQNVAKQTGDLFGKAFQGMEDALVSFVTTGKGNFKQLAQSIIADLIRIQIRAALSGIMKMLGMGLGGGIGGGVNASAGSASISSFAATGGVFAGGMRLLAQGDVLNGPRLMANGSALAGEAGPEAVMPLKRLPNGNLGIQAQGGGGGSTVNNITVTVSSNASDPNAVARQVAAEVAKQQIKMKQIADGQIMNAYRPGGIIHTKMRGV